MPLKESDAKARYLRRALSPLFAVPLHSILTLPSPLSLSLSFSVAHPHLHPPPAISFRLRALCGTLENLCSQLPTRQHDLREWSRGNEGNFLRNLSSLSNCSVCRNRFSKIFRFARCLENIPGSLLRGRGGGGGEVMLGKAHFDCLL